MHTIDTKHALNACATDGGNVGIAILLIIYGTLIEAGGVIGFVKAKSRPSLISGLVSGALLTISGVMVLLGVSIGSDIGLVLAAALCALFGWRLAKTRKMMPSGMMLFVSIVVTVILAVTMFS